MPKINTRDFKTTWKQYQSSLKDLPEDVGKLRMVVLDTETTGFDRVDDRILSIGALVVQDQRIEVGDSFERYIEQTVYNEESAKIHGLLQTGHKDQISEPQGIMELLDYLKSSVLVAHHAGFDVGMIDMCLKRMGLPGLKNPIVDTSALYYNTQPTIKRNRNYRHFTLDQLAETYKVDTKDRHTALGDAYITARILLRLISDHKIRTKKELLRKGRYRTLW